MYRRSISAVALGATVLTVCPPEIVPTLQVIPRSGSVSACSLTILRAISSIALMPSLPVLAACAALPITSIRMNFKPLRPVMTPPPGRPGSLLNTARAVRAVSLISSLDDGEPISSSEVNSAVIGDGATANRAKAASTNALTATPDFMSLQPGPEPRPSAIRNGRRPASPIGKTVSRWPSSNTGAFDALAATLSTWARIASPNRSSPTTVNGTPCSARNALIRVPTASTPALS